MMDQPFTSPLSSATGPGEGKDGAGREDLARVRAMIQTCLQCGTCTGSCPNAFAMDLTPRQLWRLVIMEQEREIFASRTFALCSTCYLCTLRCPRSLPLTQAMSALKRLAARAGLAWYRRSALFHQSFLASARRYGRVREMDFMTRYFISLLDPIAPLRFAGLGLKLMRKGKVKPWGSGEKRKPLLEPIFRRALKLEGRE
ncbi:MAG: 4Fe-4S dicluster domain-containing protein [Thermodesulfobacteriota bacterium]